MPLSLVGSLGRFIPAIGLRSVLGPVAFLANPYVLIGLALVGSHGFAYYKGRQGALQEVREVTLRINNEIAVWRAKYEASERSAEERLGRSLADARTTLINRTADPSTSACLIDAELARSILAITGD